MAKKISVDSKIDGTVFYWVKSKNIEQVSWYICTYLSGPLVIIQSIGIT